MKKISLICALLTLIVVFFFLGQHVSDVYAQIAQSNCVVSKVGSPKSGSPSLPAQCNTGAATGAGGGKVPLYKQWDPRWGSNSYNGCGTMASSACGPTSMAMVISYYLGRQVLPPEVAKKSIHVCGSGTSHDSLTSVPQSYGLKSKTISWPEAKKYLAQHLPIIQVHGPGYFTGAGHYIVVTGLNADGTYAINDPDGHHRTKATEAQITASLNISWYISK